MPNVQSTLLPPVGDVRQVSEVLPLVKMVPASRLFAHHVISMLRAAGGTALFNGRDLAGWRGRPHFDPAKEAEGTAAERAQRQGTEDTADSDTTI